MSRRLWKPSDIFWEITPEAAERIIATERATLADTKPERRFPPSCKMNGVQLVDAKGKAYAAADLYYDGWTGKWLLAVLPEYYPKVKARQHGPHDTLGALVL